MTEVETNIGFPCPICQDIIVSRQINGSHDYFCNHCNRIVSEAEIRDYYST